MAFSFCTKAGVPGKGSALASLTEEEVEKVQQFLKGGGTAKAKPVKAAPTAPQRATEPARGGKMPVIVTSKPAAPVRVKSAETVEPTEADEPVEESEEMETPIAATSAAVERIAGQRAAHLVRVAGRQFIARQSGVLDFSSLRRLAFTSDPVPAR